MSTSDEKLIDDIEECERWLGQFDTPTPSAAAMARVRQAVLSELHGHSPAGSISTMRRWKPWHGVLASAASIGLAILVGYSQFSRQDAGVDAALPVAVSESPIESDLTIYSSMDAELSELEAIDFNRGTLVDAWDEIWTISEENSNQPG